MYKYYTIARDMAWQALITAEIKNLPVDLKKVADAYNIEIVTYSKSPISVCFSPEVLKGDGFVCEVGGKNIVFLNDKIKSKNRRRFTVAHELGHVIMGHTLKQINFRNSEMDSQSDIQEYEANIFARNLLMPATVLQALNVHESEDIANICEVSKRSAEIRAKRMEMLYERKKFNSHPLEERVFEQFSEFVEKRNSGGNIW